MDARPDLKQELSMLFHEALDKQLLSGESVLVSLPGSFGEALVVTDRRAFVMRDCESGLSQGCNAFSYLLGDLTSVEAVSSSTGGLIELKLANPPAEQDQARVYFPSYDLAKFQEAAKLVSGLISAHQAAGAPAAVTATSALTPEGAQCPACKQPVNRDSVYCMSCGVQLRQRCANCGASSLTGSKFCESCGKQFHEWATACGKCGTRTQRWQTYCTECGSMLQRSCGNCGSPVVEEWKYCSGCGRQLGTGYVNPHGTVARRLQERLDEEGAAEPARAPIVSPQPAQAGATAESHNERGRALFEEEDYEGAIREFGAAVTMEPNNASYHCNLAVAFDESDQDDQALAEYEKTLQLDPNDLTALLSLGYMYNENRQPDKAQEVWGKVLQIAPDSAEAQEVNDNLKAQGQL